MKILRTFWFLVLALGAGFAVQAQRLSGSMTITNLTVTTINGYNADAVLTNSAAGKLDITNGTAINLSGSLTNVTANGIALTAQGISAAVNVTAGDLQDLASFGVFDSSYPTRARVLRDDNGYILGSGRWFNKAPTDSRVSDGITIILPIDVPSDASPGRWVLEGYEQ